MQDGQTEITQIIDSDVILNPVVIWHQVKKHSQKSMQCCFVFFFPPLLAIFLRAQAWEPCLHPLALTARGSSSICHHAWEREEVLCGTAQEGSRASLLFQPSSTLPVEGRLENSLSALFRAEKVRLSVALAGLKDLITGREPRIYTERSKEGWETSDLSLIDNWGLGAGRKLPVTLLP